MCGCECDDLRESCLGFCCFLEGHTEKRDTEKERGFGVLWGHWEGREREPVTDFTDEKGGERERWRGD